MWHDHGFRKRGELGGNGEPSRQISFEGHHVTVTVLWAFAWLRQNAIILRREEDGSFVDETGQALRPDVGTVGVIIHLIGSIDATA